MKKSFIYLLIIFSFTIKLCAETQNNDIVNMRRKARLMHSRKEYDSALHYYYKQILPLIKINSQQYLSSLIDIGNILISKRSYEEAKKTFLIADSIALETNNLTVQAKALLNLAIVYSQTNNYSKSILLLEKACPLFLETKDSLLYTISLRNLAIYYHKTYNLKKALSLYHQALDICRSIGYQKGQADCYESLGVLYSKIEELEHSIKYHKKAIQKYSALKNNYFLTKAYINISVTYMHSVNYDSAKHYLSEALILAKENHNTKSIGTSLENWGEVSYKEGKYELALNQLKEAMIAYQEIEYQEGIINVQTWQAQVLLAEGELKEANRKINTSLHTLEKTNYPASMQMALNTLRDIRLKEKNYLAAYQTMVKIHNLSDSLYEIQKAKAVLNASILYETKLTQKKNEQLEALKTTNELKIKNLSKQVLIFALSFSLFLLIGLWYFYYSKQKKKQLILRKNAETLKTIRNERDKISMELHDLIGGEIFGMLLQYQIIGSSTTEKRLTEANETFGKVYNKIRGYSRTLKSIDSKNNSLEVSILNLIHRYEANSSVSLDTNVASFDWSFLSPETKTNIYYIIQESLLNAIKYSKADKIEISFAQKKKYYEFEIIDNGQGFDKTKILNPNGLDNIKERVNKTKGSLLIDTKEGKGTKIYIKINKSSEK